MENKVQNNYPTIIVHGFLGVCEGKYNYFNYIYGSGVNTDWTGTENYDGCTLIKSSPLAQ